MHVQIKMNTSIEGIIWLNQFSGRTGVDDGEKKITAEFKNLYQEVDQMAKSNDHSLLLLCVRVAQASGSVS